VTFHYVNYRFEELQDSSWKIDRKIDQVVEKGGKLLTAI